MKTPENPSTPDFEIEWRNGSGASAESIYCDLPVHAHRDMDFLNVIALLYAPNTLVAVCDVNWPDSTEIKFTPSRPGFSLLVSVSPSSIQYGYGSDISKVAKLGQVLFMVPGKVVHAHLTPGTVRAVTCSFEPAYAEAILGPLADLSSAQITGSLDMRSSIISAILLRLMHEAIHPGPMQETIVESFGHSLLAECAHWLSIDGSIPNTNGGKLTARHLAAVEEILAGSSGTAPSVAELAAACGLSERHFSRLFREQMKCSIGQYIKSVQITKAKTYLLETELPLKEIAYRLGFSTPANFSSAFRAATGNSPGEFRKARLNSTYGSL